MLFLVYPTNSQKLFTTYLCETFTDGTKALRSDFSINCDSDQHTAFSLYALVMILHPFGPFGTPLIYYWLINSVHGPVIRRMRENERLREQLKDEALTAMYSARLERQAAILAKRELKNQAAKKAPKAPKVLVDVPTEDDLPRDVVESIDKLAKQQQVNVDSLPDYVKKLASGYKMRNAVRECARSKRAGNRRARRRARHSMHAPSARSLHAPSRPPVRVRPLPSRVLSRSETLSAPACPRGVCECRALRYTSVSASSRSCACRSSSSPARWGSCSLV